MQGRMTEGAADAANAYATPGASADRWLFRGLVFILALAPLPLASNRPLPAALLAFGIGALTTLYALRVFYSGSLPPLSLARVRWPFILFAAVCAWIGIQALPVPASLADPIWPLAAEALGRPLHGSISVNPGETVNGLMRLLAYGAAFWLAMQLTRMPERARAACNAVAMIGGVYAAYGLFVFLSGNNWVLLYHKWAYQDSLTGTFVNRNSFATFAGVSLLCAVRPILERVHQVMNAGGSLGRRINRIFDQSYAGLRLNLICAALLLLALLLTASRAGVAVTGVGLLVLALAPQGGRSSGAKYRLVAIAALGAFLALGLFIGGGRLADRFAAQGASIDEDARSVIYGNVVEAIRSDPWSGTGFGTFADVFPAYRNADRLHSLIWDKAHSTYLENALELGLPAVLALNLAIGLLVWRCVEGMRTRRRDAGFPATAVAASVLVGLHSLVDFSLQMPAVALLYAVILGFGVSQSWSSERN